MPKYGKDPIPWRKSELTPNLGMSPDTTEDMRGGMGLEGLAKIRSFVEAGGLFITVGPNASILLDYGIVDGVLVLPTRELQAQGSVLNSVIADKKSPIAYGYEDRLAIYFNQAPVFQVSLTGQAPPLPPANAPPPQRPTGRGTAADPDIVQGRQYVAPPAPPVLKPGEEPPMSEDMREALRAYLPPVGMRPRVIVKFADERDLLISGMLSGGRELAGHPAVVDVPRGKGHVLMFANNPMWRDETHGSYFLLFNAMFNFEHL
jgi:hypothetical protein